MSASDLAIVAALIFAWGSLSARLVWLAFGAVAVVSTAIRMVAAALAGARLGAFTVLVSVVVPGATADPRAERRLIRRAS